MTITQKSHLTFKANMGVSRHGWLRLTPAYSYRLVKDSLRGVDSDALVLDPFAGTGTTGSGRRRIGDGCGYAGLESVSGLAWHRRSAGTTRTQDISDARRASVQAVHAAKARGGGNAPIPPMHRVERWWDGEVLRGLAALKGALDESNRDAPADDLLLIAFCRAMIGMSNAAFNHQSMSFQKSGDGQVGMFAQARRFDETLGRFEREVENVLESVTDAIPGSATVNLDDARLMESVESDSIDAIHTSPPYCNRMSYIRELRPYMYWLGYLSSGKQAGDMDWQAIGGTWGSATSRLSDWDSTLPLTLDDDFKATIGAIESSDGRNARLLASYVHKYFYDMLAHFRQAFRVLRTGGRATYIVGNSTFYGQVVPTETWYADLLKRVGFADVSVTAIRKRNSNKKLFEYSVESVRP